MEGTQVVSFRAVSRGVAIVRPLTWADIVSDRAARGLKTRGERARNGIAFVDPSSDPRLPSNVKPHDPGVPYSGPRLTPGRAATERKRKMLACGCRLCALALNPPLTFADGERFGLVDRGFAGAQAA